MKILAIGMHEGFAEFFRNDGGYDLYILDEPDLYASESVFYPNFPAVEVRLARYQQSDEYLAVAEAWHQEIGFDAVIPCWEYAVPASGALAERFGLRYAGPRAIEACTNKLKLRAAAAEAGIAQPRFASARSTEDLHAFYRGRPIVVKPANRRQSVGVVRTDDPKHFAEAWAESVSAQEPRGVAMRELNWVHMVEEYVEGVLVSVETLVVDGEYVFDNVTKLDTPLGSSHFPITTITVPATISEIDRGAVIACSHRLVDALKAKTGMFHSEWKIGADDIQLIESACRTPGTWIPELVEQSYGVNLYGMFVRALAGRDPGAPAGPSAVSAVRYLDLPAGIVTSVTGGEILHEHPKVFMGRLKETVGERTSTLADSSRRGGYFGVRAQSAEELENLLDEIGGEIRVTVASGAETAR